MLRLFANADSAFDLIISMDNGQYFWNLCN